METATHTPGPWAIQITGGEKEVVTGSTKGLWATIEGPNFETRHANARLIAAAPELLAALQALVQAERERNECPGFASAGNFVRATEAARAAIARATGAA